MSAMCTRGCDLTKASDDDHRTPTTSLPLQANKLAAVIIPARVRQAGVSDR
jgi:hypothetical protein